MVGIKGVLTQNAQLSMGNVAIYISLDLFRQNGNRPRWPSARLLSKLCLRKAKPFEEGRELRTADTLLHWQSSFLT